VRFWDTSALVPLLVAEQRSASLAALALEDSATFVAWVTRVELTSALARRQRSGELSISEAALLEERGSNIIDTWREVKPDDELRESARRFVRLHALKAQDALQLASAWIACRARAGSLEFVCLDDRLRSAAQREGFRLRPL